MMRSLIMVSILTLSGAIANAQQITVQDHNVASLEELIGTAIISGGWDGHMQKQFGKTKARARCFPVEAPRT